jgi:flagellar biosynthesis/type III secretory pathway protein FliH
VTYLTNNYMDGLPEKALGIVHLSEQVSDQLLAMEDRHLDQSIRYQRHSQVQMTSQYRRMARQKERREDKRKGKRRGRGGGKEKGKRERGERKKKNKKFVLWNCSHLLFLLSHLL